MVLGEWQGIAHKLILDEVDELLSKNDGEQTNSHREASKMTMA